jgi:hypothetical protein
MEMGVAGGGGSIGDGIGDGIEAVGWCDGQDGEVVMAEVDCVGDAEGLGFGIDNAMAAVMLKGGANVESVEATEVPGAAGGWLVVDDDGAAKWQEKGVIVVCVCVSGHRLRLGYCKCMRYQSLVPSR